VSHLLKAPDFVSIINLLFGMASIFFTFSGSFGIAAACLLVAAAADGIDGYVARKTSSGPLGAHIDSLVDAVSFGVAPAILIYCMSGELISVLFVCFYVICGIYRLARYNAFPPQTPVYSGIPITAACVFLAVMTIFYLEASAAFEIPFSNVLIYIILFILSLLMVSTAPYPKIMKKFIFILLIILFSGTIISVFVSGLIIFPGILFLLMLFYLLSPLAGLIWKKDSVRL